MIQYVTGIVKGVGRNTVRLDTGSEYYIGAGVSQGELDLLNGRVTLHINDNGVIYGIMPEYPSTASAMDPEPEALAPAAPPENWEMRYASMQLAFRWYASRTGPEPVLADMATTARFFAWYLAGGKS